MIMQNLSTVKTPLCNQLVEHTSLVICGKFAITRKAISPAKPCLISHASAAASLFQSYALSGDQAIRIVTQVERSDKWLRTDSLGARWKHNPCIGKVDEDLWRWPLSLSGGHSTPVLAATSTKHASILCKGMIDDVHPMQDVIHESA